MKEEEESIQNKINEKERAIQEVYQDKINKIITREDFEMIYNKLKNEKKEMVAQITSIQKEIIKLEKDYIENIENKYIEMIKLAKDLLRVRNPSKELYSKLIRKIEFDSNKNIKIVLSFENKKYENAI